MLKDVSFLAEKQKLTAIVGDSGSGKSTILNLIAKYYEVDRGVISIGGTSTEDISAEQILGQISMVDQDVFLFDDTIRENIRYARSNATDAEIEAVCREANCDGFIQKMEKLQNQVPTKNCSSKTGSMQRCGTQSRNYLLDGI